MSALYLTKIDQRGIIEDAKTLFKQPDYVKIFVCFTILWGNYTAFGNVLNPFFNSLFNPSEIAIIGVGYVLSGLIGCFIVGSYLDKTKNFRKATRVLCIVLTFLYFIGTFFIEVASLPLITAFASLTGMF